MIPLGSRIFRNMALVVYPAVLWAYCREFDRFWPLMAFSWYFISELFTGDARQQRNSNENWLRTGILFLSILGGFFLPEFGWYKGTVPEYFGVYSEVTSKKYYHMVPAAGTLYFLSITLYEIFMMKTQKHSTEPE